MVVSAAFGRDGRTSVAVIELVAARNALARDRRGHQRREHAARGEGAGRDRTPPVEPTLLRADKACTAQIEPTDR